MSVGGASQKLKKEAFHLPTRCHQRAAEINSPYAARPAPANFQEFVELFQTQEGTEAPVIDADLWEELFGENSAS